MPIRDRHTASRAAHRKSPRSASVLPVAIPAVLLVGLWGTTAAGLLADQSQLRDDTSLALTLGEPAHDVFAKLQIERRLTATWQANQAEPARSALEQARAKTDAAIEAFHKTMGSTPDSMTLQERTKTLHAELEKLSENRSAIDRRTLSEAKVFQYYTDAIASSAAVIDAATQTGEGQPAPAVTATTYLVQVSEMISREDALLSSAIASGSMSETARTQFVQYAAIQRHIRDALVHSGDLPGSQSDAYNRLLSDPKLKSLTSVEDAVTGSASTHLPARAEGWRPAADAVGTDLTEIDGDSLTAIADDGSDRADVLLLQSVLGTLAVIAALLATGVLLRRATKSATGRLSELQQQIDDLGERRLPQILQELERGEHVTPGEVLPAGPDADQVERLGVAVSRLGREFETALVRQARGREGTEKVFANLTRRTQILVHRLISLLDDLERKHEDSDLLQDIFKVDHLATRVRRHSENLVILGGSAPGRRGIRPLSIMDVVRGAVSETEQYRRVTVHSLAPGSQVSVTARAVTDITHLLAELIENGTSFSPPDTQVQISARKVAKGLALHVEDRGLGMPPEQYDHLNQLLAAPPQPDMDALGKDPRLGLFVVAKLAERHGLKVSLRESDYGGTLAVVLVPSALLEEHESSLPDKLKAAASHSATLAQVIEAQSVPTPQSAASAPPAPPIPVHIPSPRAPEPITTGGGGLIDDSGVPAVASSTGLVTAGAREPHLETHGFPDYGGAGLLPSMEQEWTGAAPSSAWSPLPDQPDLGMNHEVPTHHEPQPQHDLHAHADMYAHTDPHARGDRYRERSEDYADYGVPPVEPMGQGMPPQPLKDPQVLPTRTRGASLAKQLREEAAPPRSGRENVEEGMRSFTPGRSAANMTAIQRATRRARENDSPAAELNGPAESRHNGTDEL
ncbi:nitrate- and nitrite sensing domain-containing protein [Streptomyces sp. TS71-3]|uniref:sensor histidine kinase n=1 Tax=Streptomyces sp. TS71-3 TaxID=2733862 RepID=UPI001B118907|nr:nitrate- and nitrite sensing domain-containing protein [Streptomyces sp. TS71-3]GHJ42059.1 histidine kinase [Streptomyces sp. TS71-3]